MSVNLDKLVDVRIDSASALSTIHDLVLGGSNLVRQDFAPTSTSTSNIDFTIQTPGLAVYMSRRVNFVGQIPFSFQATNNTASPITIFPGRDFGLEAFPFNSMIQSATVQVSTSSFTTQLQATMPYLKRRAMVEKLRAKLADVPTAFGRTAIVRRPGESAYAQALWAAGSEYCGIPGNGADQGNLSINKIMTTANPPEDVTSAQMVDVGGVAIPASTTYTISGTINVSEPLLIQPFELDDETPAFINVNLFSVRLNFSALDAPLALPIRFAYSGSTTNVAGSLENVSYAALNWDTSNLSALNSCKLSCQFISPPPTAAVPTKTIYPTTFYNPLPRQVSDSIAANATLTVFSNVITLNTAPDMLAIYYVPTLPDFSAAATGIVGLSSKPGYTFEDTLLSPDSLQITWNNNPSLLATFDKRELWRRSQQNGMALGWAPWAGSMLDAAVTTPTGPATPPAISANAYPFSNKISGVGGPVVLKLNADIPVEPGVAAGVAGVYTLQIQATIRNHLPFTVPSGTLYVVPITSQYLVLNAGATSDVIQTVATEEQVVQTPVTGDVQTKSIMGYELKDGHAVASSRRMWGMGRVLRGMARGGAAMLGAAGAGQYIGAKRPHLA